jgi:hypothetical protein
VKPANRYQKMLCPKIGGFRSTPKMLTGNQLASEESG